MTVPGNIDALLLGGQRGYQIERSLRFNSADSAYLNRTPASAGNRKTWTWSGWVKRSKLGGTFGLLEGNAGVADLTAINTSGDSLSVQDYSAGVPFNLVWTTTAVYRDPSAWYHIAVAYDTTQASSSNTVKIYINGIAQVVTFTAVQGSYSQNRDSYINTAVAQRIGVYNGLANYFDGYLTEVHFIDGQALTPSSFGETDTITGVWKPKKYAGTYGTNGFYLKFADNSGTTSTTLGKDSSGNGNNWTPNNFSVTAGSGNDSMIDTPTPYADGGNGRGNYATWNPLDRTAATYSNGNLDVTSTSAASPYNMASTMRFPATGKWYAEVTLTGLGAGSPSIGIGKNNSDAYAVYRITGAYLTSGMGASTSGTPNTYTTNDVIGIAYDAGAGTLEFYKNGVDQTGNISGITASTEWAIILRADSASGDAATLNAGQRAFAYTPPSGFLALNTQNLPEPSIKKPSSYMDVVIQTGNTTGRTVSGLAFQPDLVWLKNRAGSANRRWGLIDSVRGVNKTLASDRTDAEVTSQTDLLTAFNSDGFTIGADAGLYGWNGFVESYAHFVWKKSATPGFDIVTYTGNGGTQNISHNLGVSPSFIVVKNRSAVTNWITWHSTFASTDYIALNLTSAKNYAGSLSTLFTGISSTTFSIGSDSSVNGSGSTHVAYLWSEVAGFSKFGSYTGNGSSDGPFVFCGFRPKVVWIKKATGTTNVNTGWIIFDSTRGTYNVNGPCLRANVSDAESTFDAIDFTSNGFKLRTVSIEVNSSTSGDTYIFCAWAETPAKYSLAR